MIKGGGSTFLGLLLEVAVLFLAGSLSGDSPAT